MVVVATHVRCLIYTADGSSLNKNSIVPTMACKQSCLGYGRNISIQMAPSYHHSPRPKAVFGGRKLLELQGFQTWNPPRSPSPNPQFRPDLRLVPRGFQFVVPSASVGLHQLSNFPISVAATTGFRANALKFHDFQL